MNNLEIAKHLLALSNGEIEPKNTNKGVCNELGELIGTCAAFMLITKYAMIWENWSGSEIYPVPHATMSPKHAYANHIDKWGNDEYGDSRRALCKHIAQEILQSRWVYAANITARGLTVVDVARIYDIPEESLK
jgi:hypothetical protein